MSQSPEFRDYKYDLSLEHDGTNLFMVWIMACFVFIASLSLIAALASKSMIDSWQSYATNHVTLEIPYSEDGEERALQMAEALAPLSVVNKVEIIPRAETAKLVAESLGQGQSDEIPDAALLPLPMLIDVSMANASDAAMDTLRETVLDINDQAKIQRHEDWARDILDYGEALYAAALLLLILMAGMTVLTLIWTLTSRISVHHDEIEVLTIIGADDQYIARQFQHFALTRTLTGCLIGVGLAFVTLLGVRFKLPGTGALPLGILDLILWLCLPVLTCLVIAWLTCRITLIRNLKTLR